MAATLVIQPLPGIGDMIWHLPFLESIAASGNDRIDVLTKPRSRADQLLAAADYVDEVLWLEREKGKHKGLGGIFRLSQLLRQRRYQAIWLLHNSSRYAFAMWLAGIPQRIGFGVGAQRLFLTRHGAFSADDAAGHPIDKAALLLERLGVNRHSAEPHLPVVMARVHKLRADFAGTGRPWVAIGIGSSEPFKQWGAAPYAALCNRLLAQGKDTLFLVGSPAEEELAQAILGQVTQRGRMQLALKLSITDTAALLSECRLYVGNDTGFLNMAAATGVPAVGLFGGSPPLTHDSRIHCVLPDDGSEPWYGSEYMNRISVDAVLQYLERHELI